MHTWHPATETPPAGQWIIYDRLGYSGRSQFGMAIWKPDRWDSTAGMKRWTVFDPDAEPLPLDWRPVSDVPLFGRNVLIQKSNGDFETVNRWPDNETFAGDDVRWAYIPDPIPVDGFEAWWAVFMTEKPYLGGAKEDFRRAYNAKETQ